jgi:hypothetical protein
MYRRLRCRRVCGFDIEPRRLFRCAGGRVGSSSVAATPVAPAPALLFTKRNFKLLGLEFEPGPLPTAISIPPDSSSTVIPLPRATYWTVSPAVPPAGSKLIGNEKFV